jgi:hypothetical protein
MEQNDRAPVSGDLPAPGEEGAGAPADVDHVDLSKTAFAPVTKFVADSPDPVFEDPDYYKTALSGEGEAAQRLHATLTKYVGCRDPKDRGVFRPQVTTAYWELVKSLAPKLGARVLPKPKLMLTRFAVVTPRLLTAEHRQMLSTVIQQNTSGEPVYYLDEWFSAIVSGRMGISMTDEARPRKTGANARSDESFRLRQLHSKNAGKAQSAEELLRAKETQRAMLEIELRNQVDTLCAHEPLPDAKDIKSPLTEGQKRTAMEINTQLRLLLNIDKEIADSLRQLEESQEASRALSEQLTALPDDAEVTQADIQTESDTVRQMAKLSIGRQGNHFPVFTQEYFHCTPRTMGTRENVLDILAWLESIDPGAFCRVQKNETRRIVPYVLLLPTYGDTGICWEPFNRYNRALSRGRIVVPMYPKSLQLAVISAVASLRWQVAKEKAAYYWMEEGLTGQFYQWFLAQKLRGDIKDAFVENYSLWLTKESDGVQRMDKNLRAIFWRYIPFSQPIKERLKTRSTAYQELFQRDMNRAMSDGY